MWSSSKTRTRWVVLGVSAMVFGCGRSNLGDLGFGGSLGPDAGAGGSGGSAGSGGFAGGAGFAGAGGFFGTGGFAGSGGVFGTGGFAGAGGSGGGESCRSSAECDDLSFCQPRICAEGRCIEIERDRDGDGFIDVICGGDDCNDLNPHAYPGAVEDCTDGTDNDCDGVADCFDPDCATAPRCGCIAEPEVCDNGRDDDCDGAVDCLDADCAGTAQCGCDDSESVNCGDGIDNDCDGAVDCDDTDCDASPFCSCGQIEDCSNGLDDDCNLLIDCADPACFTSPACLCPQPSRPERCDNGIDDDCDGAVDCADPDCANARNCSHCEPERCDDGIDNDCDGRIDCADPACRFAPNCSPRAEICNNRRDDDLDGLVDCEDPDCKDNPHCQRRQSTCLTARLITASGTYTGDTIGNIPQTQGSCGGEAGEAVFELRLNRPSRVILDTRGSDFDTVLYVRAGSCQAGRELDCDDDSGGLALSSRLDFDLLGPGRYFVFVDGFVIDRVFGPDEGNFVLNVNIIEDPTEDCSDGRDNDGDLYADCADPDCADFGPCFLCDGGRPPSPEFGADACTDGRDNDCDGLVDCEDPDCSASESQTAECCNGLDQNDNGIADDFNCRCASDADCIPGQLCYSSTVNTCGIPCSFFIGDVCPFLAPGSVCNAVTRQCEF